MNTFPSTSAYCIVPDEEPPERQGDVIVPVINPPENPLENPPSDKINIRTQPARTSLPSRLKNAVQGKVSKVSLEGSVRNFATLFTRRVAAYGGGRQPQKGQIRRRNIVQISITNTLNSILSGRRRPSITPQAIMPPDIVPQNTAPQEGRLRRRHTVQNSLSNIYNRIQPGHRRHSMTPLAVTSKAMSPRSSTPQSSPLEDAVPQKKRLRRRNTVQNVLSNAWSNIQSNRRRHSTMSQAIAPEEVGQEVTTSPAMEYQDLMSEHNETMHHRADEFNQPETSGELDYVNQPTFSLPIERLADLPLLNPPPAPNPQPLPVTRGLRAHLRNVAPHSWVRRRLRSSESNRLSI